MSATPIEQPAHERPPIAGFWRRLAALLVDGLILAIPTLVIGLTFFSWAAGLGQAGRFVGFIVALLYFGLLNSRVGGGQTIGKRLLGIRVEDRAGDALSPARSAARFLVIGIPWFLNGLWFDLNQGTIEWWEYALGILLIFMVFGGLGAAVYLLLFNRRTRQLPHDLVVGSFVVRGPPATLPIGLKTARIHLVVVGCWLALSLVGPGIGIWLMRNSGLARALLPLTQMQTALQGRPGIRHVAVMQGRLSTATTQTGASSTTFLDVAAQADESIEDHDALVATIAGTVLDMHPDLLGAQVLVVQVVHGFDFGVARWVRIDREVHDAAAWREKLAHYRASPNRI
jgi:uncharacterized RDD family membrane protein YckC